MTGTKHEWKIVKEAQGYSVRQREIHCVDFAKTVGFYRSNCDARRAVDQLYMKEEGIK